VNLARLAETLLTLIDPDTEAAIAAATAVLEAFPGRYDEHWNRGLRAKLGLAGGPLRDAALLDDLPPLLHAHGVDFTSFFRALSASLRGDDARAPALFGDPSAFGAWAERWRAELAGQPADAPALADAMDRVNPVYIARNHHVEHALTAATAGDLQPFERLLDVVAHPFDERPGLEAYSGPAPASFAGTYQTFCGT
jgi:uncharacterized protein YdiU (UPF0061 family)